MFLNVFALIVLFVLLAVIVVLAYVLGSLPGKIAKQRNHPQSGAITVAGWVGLLLGMVLWPLALVWAYTKPCMAPVPDDTGLARLSDRLVQLEQQVAAIAEAKGGNAS